MLVAVGREAFAADLLGEEERQGAPAARSDERVNAMSLLSSHLAPQRSLNRKTVEILYITDWSA
jgi:hypothetical protein